MSDFVIFLIMLLVLIGAVAVAVRMVRWISQPIESLAQSRQAPTQFTLADLLCLFAMLQLAVGTMHYLASGNVEPGSVPDRGGGVGRECHGRGADPCRIPQRGVAAGLAPRSPGATPWRVATIVSVTAGQAPPLRRSRP